MRHPVAVHQQIALLDVIAFLHADVLALGDQVLDRLLVLLGRDHDDAPLGLVVLAEFDASVALADDREILRLARLEQLGDARQTAGDVAGLRGFARDAREHVAGLDLRSVLDREDGVDRHEVARLEPVGERQHLALARRASVIRGRRSLPRGCCFQSITTFDEMPVASSSDLAHREAFDQVDVMGDAVLLGDDRDRVGIPLGEPLARWHPGAVVGEQPRAVGHPVPRLLASGLVEQDDLADFGP